MKSDLFDAKNLLLSDGYTCVFKKGDTVYTSRKRGVKPLLEMIENKCELGGFCVADKVVGNSAAYLYVMLGISELHAFVISCSAAKTLENYGIKFSFDVKAEKIINREGTGPCPMEAAVQNAVSPQDALLRIYDKLNELTVL